MDPRLISTPSLIVDPSSLSGTESPICESRTSGAVPVVLTRSSTASAPDRLRADWSGAAGCGSACVVLPIGFSEGGFANAGGAAMPAIISARLTSPVIARPFIIDLTITTPLSLFAGETSTHDRMVSPGHIMRNVLLLRQARRAKPRQVAGPVTHGAGTCGAHLGMGQDGYPFPPGAASVGLSVCVRNRSLSAPPHAPRGGRPRHSAVARAAASDAPVGVTRTGQFARDDSRSRAYHRSCALAAAPSPTAPSWAR